MFMYLKGMGDVDANEKQEANLFFFSLLMSTILVYNSDKVFTSDDFERLSSLLTLSERVKIKEDAPAQKAMLNEELPKFIWLLRNFQSSLCDTTIAQRLEKELDEQTTEKKLNKRQIENFDRNNAIRAQIKSSFKSIEAFKIARPLPPRGSSINDEIFIAELKDYDLEKLDDFGRDVSEFVNKVIRMSKESKKKIAKNEVNGSTFALFLKKLVERLNSNETFFVQSSYELIMKQLAEEKVNEAKQLLQTRIDQLQLPKESSILKSDFDTIGKQALEVLNSSISPKELEKAVATYREFETRQIDVVVQKNNEKIYAYNVEKVLQPKFDALVEQVKKDASIKTYEQFERKLNECREFSANFFTGDEWKNDVKKYMETKKDQINLLEELVRKNSEVKDSENGQNKKSTLEKCGDFLEKMTPLITAATPLVTAATPLATAVLAPPKPSGQEAFYENITPLAKLLGDSFTKSDSSVSSASTSQTKSEIKPLSVVPSSNREVMDTTEQRKTNFQLNNMSQKRQAGSDKKKLAFQDLASKVTQTRNQPRDIPAGNTVFAAPAPPKAENGSDKK
jgi:hypothetical protein